MLTLFIFSSGSVYAQDSSGGFLQYLQSGWTSIIASLSSDNAKQEDRQRTVNPFIEEENTDSIKIPDPPPTSLAPPCALTGATLNVPGTYPTIQAAINSANPLGGDKIVVAAGTYTEQIVVNKCLSITGAGEGVTIIQSPATLANSNVPLVNARSIVEIRSNSYATISNLTVSGLGQIATSGNQVYGVFVVENGTLKMTDVTISEIRDANPAFRGIQNGNAVRAGSVSFNQIGGLDFTRVTIEKYQKTGIIVSRNGSTATITDSDIVGEGAQTYIAQNGIQINDSATATITDSRINGNLCDNPACSFTTYYSYGLLALDTGNVSISGTAFDNNDGGIYSWIPSATATIGGSVFTNARYSGIDLDQGTTNITNTYIVGSGFGPVVGVSVSSYSGNTGNTVGSVQRSSITGASQSNVELNDYNASDSAIPTLTANFNRLSGSFGGLINSTTGSTVNAENNFWGCNAAPITTPSGGCPSVSNFVDADPRLILDDTTASQASVNTGGTATVSTSLRRNSDGVDTFSLPGNPHLPNPLLPTLYPNGIQVGYSATFGTVAPTTVPLINGLALQTTFTGGGVYSGNQTAVVTAAVDNGSDFVNIIVNDTTPPTVTINQANAQPDPTTVSPVNFTVAFSEVVSGFTAADINLAGTTATVGTPLITTSDNQTFNVAIPASTSGVIIVSINAGAATDPAGNANTASTTGNTTATDNIVSFFVGAINLMVDDDGFASLTDCNAPVPAYSTIQSAINAASAGYTIRVCPGTFVEDVNVNLSNLTLIGSGAANTIVAGAIGGSGSTFQIAANNVEIRDFTISRDGNTVAQWNAALNTAGVAVQGSVTGLNLHDNLLEGNRTAIDINNSSGHTIRNNRIVNNRTGLIFRNQTDNLTVVENEITNNWTVGVLFLDGSGGTNSPVQSAANSSFSNNNISGNWYGQIVDRQSGGSLPAPGTNLKNFSGNWLGTNAPAVSNANSGEPGYGALIPVAFGGTAMPPGGQPDVLGTASANIDFSPFLNAGTDVNVETVLGRGTYGFQGDFSNVRVTAASPQANGTTGKIKEGVNFATTGGTVNILAGSYVENVDVNKFVSLLGPNAAIDPNMGTRVPEAIVYPAVGDGNVNDCMMTPNSAIFTLSAEGVTLKGLTLDGDNPALTSNYVVNSADIDSFVAVNGLSTTNPNADLSYNIVKNLGEFGLVLSGNDNPGIRTNSSITRNKIDNVVGLCYGEAIRIGENAFANVTDNVITKSFNAITVEDFNGNADNPNPRPLSIVSNNQMTVFGYAIWFNLHYAYTANSFTLSDNTINSYVEAGPAPFAESISPKLESDDTKSDVPKRVTRFGKEFVANGISPFWDRFIGIRMESIQGTVPVTFIGNTIAPNRGALNSGGYTVIDGFRITNPSTMTPNLNITGNNIRNTKRGIAHTAANAVPNVTCNNFLTNDVGIYIGSGIDYNGDPESATSGIAANNNNLVGNENFGMQAQSGTSSVNNATSNYWGAPNGAGPVGSGLGDEVSTNVNFGSHLSAGAGCAAPVAFPTVTINQAGTQNDPTGASPINFTVTFSEPVTGFTASDVKLSGTAGATTAVITGGPTVYNVAVSGMTGSGTVVAEVYAGGGVNGSGIPSLASTSTDNAVLFDVTGPTVTIDQASGQLDPATVSPINFTVVFSEPVTGFATGDVTLSGTAFGLNSLPTAIVTQIAPNDGTTFNVAVSGMNTSGTVIASIAGGVATDLYSNPNATSTSTDNTVQFNQPAPVSVVVSPTNLQGWNFLNEGATGTGSFVSGAGTPPLGAGSVRLQVNGTGRHNLVSQQFAGTRLADITELKYSSYQNNASNPGVTAISLQFDVDSDLSDVNTGFQGRLVFEPYLVGTVTQNNWQNWDLLSNGVFWGSGSGPSRPFSNACPQSNPCTRAQILALFPNLGIRFVGVSNPQNGGLYFRAGGPWTGGFDGNVDNFIIGINSASTIFDFEPAPPTVSIDDVNVTEGNAGTTATNFTVSLSQLSGLDTTVQVSTADGTATTADNDYVGIVNQTVTIPAGQLSATVSVTVNGDVVFEPNETFTVNLSNPVNATIGDGSGTGTITNDEAVPTVSIANTTNGAEPNTANVFTVTLSGLSASNVTVQVNTTNGTATAGSDYTALTNQTVTIAANSLSNTFSVATLDDNIFEGSENFTATISSPVGATLGTATATGIIADDEVQPTVSISNTTPGAEAGTVANTFTLTLSGLSATNVTVDVSTADGTASAGSDYTALTNQTVTITAGQLTNTVNVATLDDLVFEGSENFTANLSNAVNATIATGTAIGTIADNEAQPTVSIANTTNGAEPATNNVFTVTLSGLSSQPVTVEVNTSNGTATAGNDYTALTGQIVTISANTLSNTFAVVTLDDNLFEGSENFTAAISNPVGATLGTATATGIIADDETAPTVQFSAATFSDTENNVNGYITVTAARSGALGNAFSVPVTFGGGDATGGAVCGGSVDYVNAAATLSFATNDATKSFNVPICDDGLFEGNETFTATLGTPDSPAIPGTQTTATVTIVEGSEAQPTVSISDAVPATVTEGSSATFNVTLSNPSDEAITVSVSIGAMGDTAVAADYSLQTTSVTFPANTTGPQMVTVNALTDNLFEGPTAETYTVNLASVTTNNATILDGAGAGSISDADVCNFVITPTSPTAYPVAGGSGTFNISVTAGCTWTVSDNASWINSAGSGTGGATGLTYTVAANVGGARTGTITVMGGNNTGTATFNVTQDPAPVNVVIPNNITALSGQTNVAVPVNVTSDTTGRGIISYDFTINFNPAVVQYTGNSTTGTLSNGWVVTPNVNNTTGVLTISGFSATPLAGSGTLLNLSFTAVGGIGTSSNMNFANFIFNNGNPDDATTNGLVTIVSGAVSGQVTYANAPTTTPVSNVTLNAAGSTPLTATTNMSGSYSFSNFGSGAYTITPSKTGQVNGIQAFDAALIAQHVVNLITLTANQLAAADVSNDMAINSFDAALIAQYVAAIPNPGVTGTWRFNPVNRSYPSGILSNQTNQDFSAILMGDVDGNWNPAIPLAETANGEEQKENIGAPVNVTAVVQSFAPNTNFSTPIFVDDITGQNIISYQFDLVYNPGVITPQGSPCDNAGTVSSGLLVVCNVPSPGLLKVAVFGFTPISGSGTLLNLRFTTAAGPLGSSTPLDIQNFLFNNGTPTNVATDGQITISVVTSANASLKGSLVDANGGAVSRATVVLTGSDGVSRSVSANNFGKFEFADLTVGETYTVSVKAKGYSFTPRAVSISADVTDLVLTAEP